MRSRLRTRAALATLLVALLAAVWFALSVALLPEPPVPREILLGGGGVCLILFAVIGGLAIIEALADELEIREREQGGSSLRFVKLF